MAKGDVISITAAGDQVTYGFYEKGSVNADGDAGTQVAQQGFMANVAALLVRIGTQTFVAGQNLVNWSVPARGELELL